MTFLDILNKYGVKTSTSAKHSTAGWLNFQCPFCGTGSSNLGMGYHLRGNYVHCWKCGHHPLAQTLAAAADIPVATAYQLLDVVAAAPRANPGRRPGTFRPPAGVGPLARVHRDYLRQRGLSVKAAERWGVGGIGLAARLAWTLYLPVALDGEDVSWTTRAIGNTEVRYLSASAEEEKVSHHTLLYGEGMARHAVVIVEGPLDAVRIGPGAVATMGVSYTREQLLRMARYPSRAVLFDTEREAQKRGRKLVRELEGFPGKTHLVTLDAKDPGEASDKEIRAVRKYFLDGGG